MPWMRFLLIKKQTVKRQRAAWQKVGVQDYSFPGLLVALNWFQKKWMSQIDLSQIDFPNKVDQLKTSLIKLKSSQKYFMAPLCIIHLQKKNFQDNEYYPEKVGVQD